MRSHIRGSSYLNSPLALDLALPERDCSSSSASDHTPCDKASSGLAGSSLSAMSAEAHSSWGVCHRCGSPWLSCKLSCAQRDG